MMRDDSKFGGPASRQSAAPFSEVYFFRTDDGSQPRTGTGGRGRWDEPSTCTV